MILTNQQIYNYATILNNWNPQVKLPIKVNFFLQKNIQTLISAAQEINQMRISIAQLYGVQTEKNGIYIIPEEKRAEVAKDLEDLFSLEQDLNIKTIKLEYFENIELTMDQLAPILFMIEE